MHPKIHMHDQVFNKVNDIMKHYKRTPVEQLLYFIKHFIKHASVVWGPRWLLPWRRYPNVATPPGLCWSGNHRSQRPGGSHYRDWLNVNSDFSGPINGLTWFGITRYTRRSKSTIKIDKASNFLRVRPGIRLSNLGEGGIVLMKSNVWLTDEKIAVTDYAKTILDDSERW